MLNKKFKQYWFFIFLIYQSLTVAQSKKNNSELSLLFLGDIMGHDTQIQSAYNYETDSYNYHPCFKYVHNLISQVDIAVANLEVTLGGKPYKGYPSFSSPDELAVACKNSGIDILMTANNHCYDRGKKGFERTIKILDSLEIKHTGTFTNQVEKKENNPLIIDIKRTRLAFLNYTYGTNSIVVKKPNLVNKINKYNIKNDIEKAHEEEADMIIIYFHWGTEYKSNPDSNQISLYRFCTDNGADIIIGSHPHVIQRIEWHKNKSRPNLVAYSLGNFISNQRPRKRDGGLMMQITIKKNNHKTVIENAGYYLTWVYTPVLYGKKRFFIMPVARYEKRTDFFIDSAYMKMKTFAVDSKTLLKQQNNNVYEYMYDKDTGKWILE